MKKSLTASALILAACLSGCESLSEPGDRLPEGASVTRTHLGQPIARGEIRVEPSSDAAASTDFVQEESAVGRELARLGWTVLPAKTTTEQVALVRVTQIPGDRVATELRVRIQRRSDATVAWEGQARAEARAGSPMAAREAAVNALVAALFRDFPGESGRTIRVR